MPETIIPHISIIVASHREQFVDGLVSSFEALDRDPVPTEIIIVADYPVEQFKDKFPHIRWIHVPDKSISAKRNKGITSARGSICAFIDDDCRPSENWISDAVAFLDMHPDMVGVEGMTAIASSDTREGSYREFKRLEKRGYRTNNIFYRRETLLSMNMFDERFTVQREDVDLAYTLLESGNSIGYLTDLRVEHQFRKNEKWDLLKNCINRRFDPLLFKKHKALYRQHIGTPYPPSIILIFITHVFAIITSISMNSYAPYIYGIDLLAILIFTVRRAGIPFVTNPLQWTREFVSFCVAPFVLCGALIYGSIRFRYIFLI